MLPAGPDSSAAAPPAGPPAVECRNLSFSYDGPPVLEDATLTIAAGDFACLVGPNGGGKTTLLRLILGLLRPTHGVLRVFGEAPQRACRRIGYMPQRTQLDPQFPVTVLDVVLMGRLSGRRFGFFGRADRAVARAALDTVRMADYAERSFARLSGGQRQRVLIARALACAPDLLLLDEPTANLDPAVEGELYELLRELNRRMTVVIVSHDVGIVWKFVQTVVCVNRRVMVHATSRMTPEIMQELYGHDIQLVLHDHGHGHGHGHQQTHQHGPGATHAEAARPAGREGGRQA